MWKKGWMVIDGSNKKVGADQNRVLAGISALLK